MSGWTYANNWSTIPLTEQPYEPGISWRAQGGSGKLAAGVWGSWTGTAGITQTYARAGMMSTVGFYHIEDAYNLTGNPWIKDWYSFAGEFRKATLFNPN